MDESTTAVREPARATARSPFLMFAIAYTLLAVVQTFPLVLRLSSVVPHDVGDPLMSTAILWWNAHVLPFTDRWWDGFAFFPAKGSMAFSDPRVGEALIAAPLQWIGLGPVAAYNLTFLATYPLSALAAHYLAFVLTRRHGAAAIAGLAFGFCPFRGAHLSHLELLAAYGMPVALAALHQFMSTRRRRWLVLYGAALVVQGLSSSYYLLFFGVILAVWVVWFVRIGEFRALLAIAAATVAAGVLLLPLAIGYIRIHAFHGLQRSFTEIVLFSADATALFAADRGLLFWGWTSRFGELEGFIFPGVVLPALVLASGLVFWRRIPGRDRIDRFGRLALAGAAVALVIAALSWSFDPWRVELPGLRISSDSPHKQVSIALLLALVWLGSSTPMRRAWRRRSAFAFYVLATILLFLCSFGPQPRFAGHEFLYQAPYRVIMNVPAFGSVRVPARFAMPAMLALATAGALAFSQLGVAGTRRRTLLGIVLIGIAADGWLAPVPLAAVPEKWPASRAAGFAAVIEMPLGDLFGDLAAMYRETGHGKPVVNGSSGFQPGHYAALRSALDEHDPNAFDWLSPSGRSLIVVDRSVPRAADWDRFVASIPRVTPLASDGRWGYYSLDPAPAPAPVCSAPPLEIRSISASDGPIDLHAVTDDNPRTWWATTRAQREGDSVTLDFGVPSSPCAVALAVGEFQPGYPHNLIIESSADGGSWTTVLHLRPSPFAIRAALLDPKRTAFTIPLPPSTGRYLRLRLDHTNAEYPWHITDLQVLGTVP